MDEALFDKIFNDVAKRACIVCKASLADDAPEDLIETKLGLVCAECLAKPEVFFETLPRMERVQ